MEEHFVPNVPGQTQKRKIQSSIVINKNPSWKEKKKQQQQQQQQQQLYSSLNWTYFY